MTGAGRQPPRLLTRTLVAVFAGIALVLATVFIVLMLEARERVTRVVAENLDAGQRTFAALDRQRRQDLYLRAASLAENPTLKAALDTYQAEIRRDATARGQLLATVERELSKLAEHLTVDVVAVTDVRSVILASTGPGRAAWQPGTRVEEGVATDSVVRRAVDVFRVVTVPLTLGSVTIGSLHLASLIDEGYATQLAELSRAQIAIVIDREIVATTLDPPAGAAFEARARAGLPENGVVALAGERYAVRRLFGIQNVGIYGADSISAAARSAVSEALGALAMMGAGALALGAVASLWLARTLTRPIDELSQSLARMADGRTRQAPLARRHSSREVDALIDTFNALLRSVATAEAETEAAYVGAIKALAAALDARDPYTAGHSERVSALSVRIGRQAGLDDEAIEVLRLGALLHDIGKIGVSDAVLRKAGPLTEEEFEAIKAHPTLGARILQSVPFLSPHLAIVELHHERPDGQGYPHGLRGSEIPEAARIVHVADAFDAMTSARAYREALSVEEALAELWRYAGTQFDSYAVQQLLASGAATAVGERRQREGRRSRSALVSFEPRRRDVEA